MMRGWSGSSTRLSARQFGGGWASGCLIGRTKVCRDRWAPRCPYDYGLRGGGGATWRAKRRGPAGEARERTGGDDAAA